MDESAKRERAMTKMFGKRGPKERPVRGATTASERMFGRSGMKEKSREEDAENYKYKNRKEPHGRMFGKEDPEVGPKSGTSAEKMFGKKGTNAGTASKILDANAQRDSKSKKGK